MRLHLLLIVLLCLPIVQADLISEVSEANIKARQFSSDYKEVTLIIEGTYASKIEKLAKDNAIEKNWPLQGKPVKLDSEVTLAELSGTVLLIGGPTHNAITAQIKDLKHESQFVTLTLGYVELVTTDSLQAIIISDRAGYNNLPRTNAANSPLAKFIPLGFVPLAATLIGVTFAFLAGQAMEFGADAAKSKTNKHILSFAKKKPIKPTFHGFHLFNVRIKAREWAAIIGASLIYAAAISYSYYINKPDIILYITLTLSVNIALSAIKHLIRLVMDAKQKLHTEFALWPAGIAITLITGWLGNTFSVTGYTKTEGNDKREALADFLNALIMFIVFLVSGYLNLTHPHIFLQMVSVLAITGAFISMLPLPPFEGRKVYGWSKKAWWALMVPMTVFYMLIALIV